MKKLFITLVAAFLLAPSFAQSIFRIIISDAGQVESIAFEVEPSIMLLISPEGNIINWGYDVFKDRGGENYTGKLEPYVGRVEYYTANDNEAFRGKIKSIGRTTLLWYADYENDAFRGKLKSVGSSPISYYEPYEDGAIQGKIKSVGNNAVTWYPSYNNEAIRGKLKSIGSTQFAYYTSFDDKAYAGKLKSLDGTQFTYYSSFDRVEYRGRMKSGTQLLFNNGIKYFVRN
ncbi:MAG: hypothetical protein IPI66_15190 [Chitinophagaceae bacterium]|nr:hypothetical protein [Chitinophagaceae bacterium]MBL0056693.1 hypothetical protein [Chitinophagaceae bacterium]